MHPRPTAGPAGETTAVAAQKPRDPLLDNARAILITLVVVGHAIESMDTQLESIIYTWIYSFHMPAFIAISGFLSRNYRNEPRQVSRLLTGLVLPYLIFQVLHSVEQDLLKGNEIGIKLWLPVWTLWFLLALTAWRLFTPVLRVLRYPLVFTVAISVVAPLDAALDSTLSWARILSFLPFFVLGLTCTPEMLSRVRDLRGAKVIGGMVLLCALVFSALTHDMFSTSIFTMSQSYEARDMEPLYGVVTRLLALAAGAVLTIALIMVSPRRTHWFTSIGVRSLTVYLLHSMVIEFPRQLEWFADYSGPGPTVLVIIGAVALTVFLSRKPVVQALSWLTAPPVGHLLMRPEKH